METTVFEIGGKEFNVVKRGIDQAQQVAALGCWFAQYGTGALQNATKGGALDSLGGIELIGGFVGGLNGHALVELFSVVFGCSIPFSKEHFDIAILIDGIVSLYENQPAVKRLASRFFSVTPSIETEESISTQSDQPTDGLTK